MVEGLGMVGGPGHGSILGSGLDLIRNLQAWTHGFDRDFFDFFIFLLLGGQYYHFGLKSRVPV